MSDIPFDPTIPGGLGRLPAEDPRDQLFSVAPMLVEETRPPYRYWWANGWWGDQGQTSHCVEYSLHHFMTDGPITHNQPAPLWPLGSVYSEAQKVDEWPGENYEGTSVRAGAKILQKLGKISQYRWAFTLDDIVATILTISPIVVGTNWYEHMFYPNKAGKVTIGGKVAGGHAYLLNGVNTKTQTLRIKNSWGKGWGKGGHAYISFEDMNRLLTEQGEALIALEVPTKE